MKCWRWEWAFHLESEGEWRWQKHSFKDETHKTEHLPQLTSRHSTSVTTLSCFTHITSLILCYKTPFSPFLLFHSLSALVTILFPSFLDTVPHQPFLYHTVSSTFPSPNYTIALPLTTCFVHFSSPTTFHLPFIPSFLHSPFIYYMLPYPPFYPSFFT